MHDVPCRARLGPCPFLPVVLPLVGDHTVHLVVTQRDDGDGAGRLGRDANRRHQPHPT
jgi:hypothetical protein